MFWCQSCATAQTITCPWCDADACARCWACVTSGCGPEGTTGYRQNPVAPVLEVEYLTAAAAGYTHGSAETPVSAGSGWNHIGVAGEMTVTCDGRPLTFTGPVSFWIQP